MDDDKVSLSVRKGAWAEEEDDLLRRCIEKHGEGKWHQIPFKAGLNRCRKSCRLRWLNYLKPTIKRGEFADDEIDLITRLHKLLGNRWSLIAGRLPGRTANDVKNYWNSLLRKKVAAPPEEKSDQKKQEINVFKPRPWSFTKNLSRPLVGNTTLSKAQAPPPPPPPGTEDEMFCWENLLRGNEDEKGQSTNPGGFSESIHWGEKEILSSSGAPLAVEDGLSSWTDFVTDMDIWEWDFKFYNN